MTFVGENNDVDKRGVYFDEVPERQPPSIRRSPKVTPNKPSLSESQKLAARKRWEQVRRKFFRPYFKEIAEMLSYRFFRDKYKEVSEQTYDNTQEQVDAFMDVVTDFRKVKDRGRLSEYRKSNNATRNTRVDKIAEYERLENLLNDGKISIDNYALRVAQLEN